MLRREATFGRLARELLDDRGMHKSD